jgi:hypothetical protein
MGIELAVVVPFTRSLARTTAREFAEKILWEPGRIISVHTRQSSHSGRFFISSMPIRDLILALDPRPPWSQRVADSFHYRDFLIVALIVRAESLFPDNWLYIHDSSVRRFAISIEPCILIVIIGAIFKIFGRPRLTKSKMVNTRNVQLLTID